MSVTTAPPLPARPAHPQAGLKRFLPRHLFTRSLIIMVAPMVLLQAVALYLFLADHEASTTAKLTAGQVDQIRLVLDLIQGADNDAERMEVVAEASQSLGMMVTFADGAVLPAEPGTTDTEVGWYIGQEMSARVPQPHWFDAKRFGEQVDLRVAVANGVARFLIERKRFININQHIFPVWMLISSIVFLTIAVLFLRNQIRPIQRLALAAEAFGRGRDVPDFRPSGATEVRRAAIAFIGMKQRLARQMQQRTDMLAGVSHDLRTPLTRMKLELAMMDPDQVADMQGDVAEMERMLDGYLAFARGEGGEQSQRTDLADLVAEVAADAARKSDIPVDVTTQGDLVLEVKRDALKRCLVNLVDNAQKYGTHVAISAERKAGAVELIVDDDGPGIPRDKRVEAVKPFRRLGEDGRNISTGGVGLGLAIAKDIARAHGGDLRLHTSPTGGLRALVRLPV